VDEEQIALVDEEALARIDEEQVARIYEPEKVVVRMFGDFMILKGGRHLEGQQLQRSKVRALLIHLALNMGRGISRDAIIERFWPEKDPVHAKDNFYSTWSMLNNLLAGTSRNNPYLSNSHGLCRLEPDHVIVDVYEFERLSKAILFQQGGIDERIDAIYRLEQLYRGDIMAGTRIDRYVQAAQARYRSILVDVMIEASTLFSREGNDNNAVWFARKAFDADPSREDVYRTLMAMQDKAGQRTSALRTYFDCKKFLSEELGILPSQKTIALYQELVLDRR
jgi:DNA-binding SARP family transcriptional activator